VLSLIGKKKVLYECSEAKYTHDKHNGFSEAIASDIATISISTLCHNSNLYAVMYNYVLIQKKVFGNHRP